MKRYICLILCLAIILICPTFSVQAEDDGFLFVLGDEIIFADSKNAPFAEKTNVYFPLDFILPLINTSYVIEEESHVVNVFFRNVSIAFDTSSGIALTSDNRNLYESLPYKDGRYYISMSLIAREDARIFTTLSGGIYRLKTTANTVLDADFNRLLITMPSSASLRDKTPKYYFVAFGVGNQTQKQLNLASSHNSHLTVFISDRDILDAPMSVCSLIASGADVGIYPSDSFMAKSPTDTQIANELVRINEMLYRLTRSYAQLCALKSKYNGRCATLADNVKSLGMSLWCASLVLPDDFSSNVSANNATKMWQNIQPFITWDMCVELTPTSLSTSIYDSLLDSTKGITKITPGKTPLNYVETIGS